MAGLSDEVRERLNKGYSMYKNQLGDLIQAALLEAVRDQTEDTSWGNDIAKKIEGLVPREDLKSVLTFLMQIQNSFGTPENLMQAFTTLSNKVDALQAQVDAL